MSPKHGPINIIHNIDYDSLINRAIKEQFIGYNNNSKFEIDDDLSDAKNVTHYMKRLLMVIYKEYINKKERDRILEIYLFNIQQFMIKYKLNEIYLDQEIYQAALVIFEKTVKDRSIIQKNNLNQNPWEVFPSVAIYDCKDIIYENDSKELKKLKITH